MDKDLVKMRDMFRDIANIMDEVLELEIKEAAGEDVKKETESAVGRLMFKMVEMDILTK